MLALAGVALSLTQLKVKGPFRLSSISSYIPYTGWMRWHYIAGAVFGVLTFTWVFSGLLWMETFGLLTGPTLEGNLHWFRARYVIGRLDNVEIAQQADVVGDAP